MKIPLFWDEDYLDYLDDLEHRKQAQTKKNREFKGELRETKEKEKTQQDD